MMDVNDRLLRASVIWLLVLTAVGLWSAIQPPAGKARADDEAVIEAAMLAFYPKSEWNDVDWSQGDFVVLQPAFLGKERVDFEKSLAKTLEGLEKWPAESIKKYPDAYRKSKAKAKKLRDEVFHMGRSGLGSIPSEIRQLAQLKLDPRIVVRAVERDMGYVPRIKVTNREGKQGSIRALVTIRPPGYSINGQYAVVEGHAPWSMHSADLAFYLRRTETGWKVVQVEATYYV